MKKVYKTRTFTNAWTEIRPTTEKGIDSVTKQGVKCHTVRARYWVKQNCIPELKKEGNTRLAGSQYHLFSRPDGRELLLFWKTILLGSHVTAQGDVSQISFLFGVSATTPLLEGRDILMRAIDLHTFVNIFLCRCCGR